MIASFGLLAILSVGLASGSFLPNALPRFAPGRIATAFLLGVGVNGAVLFLLGILEVPLTPIVFGSVPAVGVAVAALRWRYVVRMRWRGDIHELVSTAAILLPFVLVLWVSAIVPLSDYDGRTTWLPKAVAIAGEGSIRGDFFHGRLGLNLHNRYPLLMPLNAASLIALRGDVRFLYILVAPAMLLAARDLLAPRYGRPITSWCMAALAWLPQIVVAPEGGATSAYNDLTVAAFFGLAVATRVARPHRVAAAGIWCAFLVLTKNEGLLLAMTVAAYRPKWQITVFAAMAFAALVVWQQSIPDAYDERNSALLLELPQRIERLDDAALAIGRHASDVRMWGVFWPLLLACFAIGRRPLTAAIPLVLALAGYVVVMACTSWNIDQLARVTAHRLLLHCVIPASIIMIATVQRARNATVTPLSST